MNRYKMTYLDFGYDQIKDFIILSNSFQNAAKEFYFLRHNCKLLKIELLEDHTPNASLLIGFLSRGIKKIVPILTFNK